MFLLFPHLLQSCGCTTCVFTHLRQDEFLRGCSVITFVSDCAFVFIFTHMYRWASCYCNPLPSLPVNPFATGLLPLYRICISVSNHINARLFTNSGIVNAVVTSGDGCSSEGWQTTFFSEFFLSCWTATPHACAYHLMGIIGNNFTHFCLPNIIRFMAATTSVLRLPGTATMQVTHIKLIAIIASLV